MDTSGTPSPNAIPPPVDTPYPQMSTSKPSVQIRKNPMSYSDKDVITTSPQKPSSCGQCSKNDNDNNGPSSTSTPKPCQSCHHRKSDIEVDLNVTPENNVIPNTNGTTTATFDFHNNSSPLFLNIPPEEDEEVIEFKKSLDRDATEVSYGKKWEYFRGKNKFYCDGRIMTSPSIPFCIVTFFLILVTFVLFIVFDGPFLANELTIAIPIIASVLFVLVVSNMVKTSLSDPGIVPRASQQESEFIENSYGSPTHSRPPPRTKEVVVNGQTIKCKFCYTCKIFRPPRVSHCGVCDNCVDRFDHHCPFLGNCIGRRNYRSFYAFVVFLSLLSVFVLSCAITHLALLSKQEGNLLEALRSSPTTAVVIVISFFGMWTVLGLAGFHTYLIAVEQTTNEDIKGLFGRADAKNPYSRGSFCRNCCYILCGPMKPSIIDARAYATKDFVDSLPNWPDQSSRMNRTQRSCASQSTNKPTCSDISASTAATGGNNITPKAISAPVGGISSSSKVYQTNAHQPFHVSVNSPRPQTQVQPANNNTSSSIVVPNSSYNNGVESGSSSNSGITQVSSVDGKSNNSNSTRVKNGSALLLLEKRPGTSSNNSNFNNKSLQQHSSNTNNKERRVSLETTTMINSPLDLDQVT